MHEALDRLAHQLFLTFARFEYALKAAGFYERRHDDDARPDWTEFARSVSGVLNNPPDPGLQAAIKYIVEHPPQKQIIRDGTLNWREGLPPTQPGNQADLVIMLVRRVRNNLFHGGKFSGQWFNPARSKLLLKHSLTILLGCLEASPEVRGAYHNNEWHT